MTDRRAKWPISRCPLYPHPIKPGEWIRLHCPELTAEGYARTEWAHRECAARSHLRQYGETP